MIKATDARQIVNNAVEREVEEKRTRAHKFCEELSTVITDRASKKLTRVAIEVEQDIKNYVGKELTDNGYKVEYNTNNTINIMW